MGGGDGASTGTKEEKSMASDGDGGGEVIVNIRCSNGSKFAVQFSLIVHHIEKPKMVAEPFTVDLTKPLVFQVGHLKTDYDKWVHQPMVRKEGPHFFENDFMELLTYTKWWVIPIVWLLVISWLVSVSIGRGLAPPLAAASLGAGVLFWTFLEYFLHRFLFHMKTTRYWKECHCILFLTLDNDFAGTDQTITLDEIRESTASM